MTFKLVAIDTNCNLLAMVHRHNIKSVDMLWQLALLALDGRLHWLARIEIAWPAVAGH